MTGENRGTRWLRPLLLPAAAALLLAACGDPLDPAAFAAEPCRVIQATGFAMQPDPILAADLDAALSDAAMRLTLSLPEADRHELRAALAQMAAQTGNGDDDTACRALLVARDVLNRQPDSLATLPDRSAMWLAIELAAASMVR